MSEKLQKCIFSTDSVSDYPVTDLLILLAQSAYSLGAQDAHRLSCKTAQRAAQVAVNSLEQQICLRVMFEITRLDPLRCMPDFRGIISVVGEKLCSTENVTPEEKPS